MLLSALQPPASSISSILPFSIRSQLHVGSSSRAPHLAFALALAALITAPTVRAQEMQWEDYEPRSTLVVKEHTVTRAKYPFVDAHAHQWEIGDRPESAIKDLVAEMDALNMAVMVNLSGGSGETLRKNVETTERYAPGRFVHFANIDFSTIDDPDFGTKAAERLREDVANGARGLKIFKNLGMEVFYEDGTRVPTDDPRLDPIWETAGELGIPVLIHTGDPAPFWEPQDRFNERWFELKERPRRKRSPEPSWETIMGEHWNLIRKHPNTTFISAHLSWLGNDLGRLGKLLDELPNMYTELGAVLAELGRQPRTARQFLIDYQDRVLMGKDAWGPEEYHVYFRTLETTDEYFPYYRKRHAFWRMYGLDLPDEVLRKVYFENARAIIPGIEGRFFPEE